MCSGVIIIKETQYVYLTHLGNSVILVVSTKR